jgi:hypothetical protein
MTTDNKPIVIRTKQETPTFIKKKHELAGVLKRISEGSKKAVALLIDTVENDAVDLKLRVECAKSLITFETSITEQISKDNMNRLIAEIKLQPGGANPQLTTEEDETYPVLDFHNVREVS